MNRRQFVQHAAAAAVALAANANASEGRKDMLPIVDTHQHLWDLKKFRLPWVKEGSPLAHDHLLADYQKASEGLNVVKTVYMEVDVAPEQQSAEAEYVTALCRQPESRMAAAVVSGRPATEGFGKYLDQFKDNKFIKGVRQVLHVPETPPGFCLGKDFVKGVRLLGERGLSFDLCMRARELPDAAKLIDECPGTRFILDHCGNADVQAPDRSQWQKDMAAVAQRKNVVCKVSGIVASAKKGAWTADDLAPIVKHTLEVFGPERVMFGGDWPVCTLAATLRQWVEALQTIVAARPQAERRKLFHDNAVRFYGLA
jgi:predicted TIM-barrel fold metal-dependent hydrolase